MYRPRLSVKTQAKWYTQSATARAFHRELSRCPASHVQVGGSTVLDLVISYGVLNQLDLRGYIASCQGLIRRGHMLLRHDGEVGVHSWHFVDRPDALRPVCRMCGAVGPVNYKSIWLRQACAHAKSHSVDLAACIDNLYTWTLVKSSLSHTLGDLLLQYRRLSTTSG
eukprot:6464895-Amphidinium_carterae.1